MRVRTGAIAFEESASGAHGRASTGFRGAGRIEARIGARRPGPFVVAPAGTERSGGESRGLRAALPRPREVPDRPRIGILRDSRISSRSVSDAPSGLAALRFAPYRHPGPRAGVHPWLPMPPQPVENRANHRGCRENRGWAPARGPGRPPLSRGQAVGIVQCHATGQRCVHTVGSGSGAGCWRAVPRFREGRPGRR